MPGTSQRQTLARDKEHALELLNGLYNTMLSDRSIGRQVYMDAMAYAETKVDMYYRDLLGLPIADTSDRSIARTLEGMDLPLKVQHEATEPDKILSHSIEIMEQMNKSYDYLVSILFGGIELGFALKSVARALYDALPAQVYLIKYSRYDDNDAYIKIPHQLMDTLPVNADLLLMDDSVGTGNTLYDSRQFFNALGNRTDMTATEISYIYLEDIRTGRKSGDTIDLKDMSYVTENRYRKR